MLTKLSKDVFTGLPCISTVFLLSSLLNRSSEVSQCLSWLDSFGFPGFCSAGTFKRNCSVSWARPVISDRHFGQTLDGRPDLEKRGKIANFLTENLEKESKSANFLNLNKPASSAEKMSIATLEDLPGWNHFFQTHLDKIQGKERRLFGKI